MLLQEFDLQMIQRIISKEEEDPGALQTKSTNEKSENIHIYIPPGTVHSERPLTHFMCNNFTGFASGAQMKETNNTKLGDVTRPPGYFTLMGGGPSMIPSQVFNFILCFYLLLSLSSFSLCPRAEDDS